MGWCGSGHDNWKEKLVPDIYKWLFRADFTECCKNHDYAYSKGGSEDDRRVADIEFYNCMLRVVDKSNKWKWQKRIGYWIARLYFRAVRKFGWKHFNYKTKEIKNDKGE